MMITKGKYIKRFKSGINVPIPRHNTDLAILFIFFRSLKQIKCPGAPRAQSRAPSASARLPWETLGRRGRAFYPLTLPAPMPLPLPTPEPPSFPPPKPLPKTPPPKPPPLYPDPPTPKPRPSPPIPSPRPHRPCSPPGLGCALPEAARSLAVATDAQVSRQVGAEMDPSTSVGVPRPCLKSGYVLPAGYSTFYIPDVFYFL